MSEHLVDASDSAVPATALQPSAASRSSPRGDGSLRLWPGVVIVTVEWLAILLPKWLDLEMLLRFPPIVFGPFVASLALAGWWLFASRVPWRERAIVLFVCAAMGAIAVRFAPPSLGIFGFGLALRVLTTSWVLWLLASRFLRWPARRAGLMAAFGLLWACFLLVRRDGADGDLRVNLHYRWTPTVEDKFLDELAGRKDRGPATENTGSVSPPILSPGDWPGFRGPNRDGRASGEQIAGDLQRPPRQVWRHRVGPAWSSFAVVGNRLYTQEQRGSDEAVICYQADSGSELWVHLDACRFSEEQSGAGPRATPSFHEGQIYTLGGSGRLNCLDAATGEPRWSRDIVADSGAEVPQWGFSASPLVSAGVVTVFAGGASGRSVLGYDASSGELTWSADAGQGSYCSLQPARLSGVDQLMIVTETGLAAVDPADGHVLWRHAQPVPGPTCIVQPIPVGDSQVLLSSGGSGTRLIGVTLDAGSWNTAEVWASRAIRPFFNDLVVHEGHLYGFNTGGILVCVSLEDGRGKWRARGYGNGQVLLLADQGLLIVVSETGEIALVDASPSGHTQRGRFQAVEGKTWNHPVVAHGKLFVRNSEEAACYQLSDVEHQEK